MDTDDQEEVFEEDEMENVNELASSKRLDCVDHNGKLKAIRRERDHRQNKHSCGVCGKTFDNGRALGGHMRVHFQFKKVAGPNIKNKTEHFSSMRAHSDGEWKGIHRRSCSSTMSDSVSNDNNGYSELSCAKSDTECLKNVSFNWSQTGRRGRKTTGAVEGAENLMFISRQSVIDIKDQRFDTSEAEKQSLNEQLEVGRGGSLSLRLGNKGTDEIHREKHDEQKMKKKKAAAKILMEMLSSDSEETDEEVGLMHDKNDGKWVEISFPTDQALGGHRSIHKNRQLEVTIISVIEPYGASSPGAASQTSPTKMNFDLSQLNYDMEDEDLSLCCISNPFGDPSEPSGLLHKNMSDDRADLKADDHKTCKGSDIGLLSFPLSEEESPGEACQTSPRTMDLELNETNDDMKDKGIDT